MGVSQTSAMPFLCKQLQEKNLSFFFPQLRGAASRRQQISIIFFYKKLLLETNCDPFLLFLLCVFISIDSLTMCVFCAVQIT